jgi:general secretion pathway protein K
VPRRGFILVAALWILIALATLASIATVYVARSAVALTAVDDAVLTEPIITASLELTAYQLSAPTDEKRPTRGTFRFRLARTNVTVEFLSEAARVDLNAAPKPLIAGLFASLGAQPEAAYRYADRVVGWRTAPKEGAQDGEESLYRAAGLQYSPRGAPFNHVDELWLVLGLPPDLVERALPFLTVYSGRGDVNVLDAPPEILAALPNMSPGRLNAFLNQRETLPPDPSFVAGALGDDQAGATVKGSSAYRVRTLMSFENGRQKMSEVVIMIATDGAEPYRVLSWKDDIDAATGAPRAGGR